MFRGFNKNSVYILNGTLNKWKSDGYPIEVEKIIGQKYRILNVIKEKDNSEKNELDYKYVLELVAVYDEV